MQRSVVVIGVIGAIILIGIVGIVFRSNTPSETGDDSFVVEEEQATSSPERADENDKQAPTSSLDPAVVEQIAVEECNRGENCLQYTLQVSCLDLPTRTVNVWHNAQDEVSQGSVVLVSGGNGRGLYQDDADAAPETVEVLYGAGYEIAQVDWTPEETGWFVHGQGYARSACGFAPVVDWIEKTLTPPDAPVCAHGNSGGALLIAYGLSVYGAEESLDMVVLSAGPPVVDVERTCFDPEYLYPQGPALTTDMIMGWDGDYCLDGSGPEDAHIAADRTSLISDRESRDFFFTGTRVNIVGAFNDAAARRSVEYYDAITSEKAIHLIPNSSVHRIHEHEVGASKIRELFLNECSTMKI